MNKLPNRVVGITEEAFQALQQYAAQHRMSQRNVVSTAVQLFCSGSIRTSPIVDIEAKPKQLQLSAAAEKENNRCQPT